MKLLDLSKFKKVSEDKQSATMKHDDGHTMIISVKSLPKIQQEALKRLPLYEGGELKGVHTSSSDTEKPSKNARMPKAEKSMAGESKAGEHIRSNDIKSGGNEKAKAEHTRVLGEMKSLPNPKLQGLAKGGHVEGCQCAQCFADGGEADTDASDSSTPSQPPVVVNVGQPSSPQQVSPAATQAAIPVNVQKPNVPQQNPNVLLPNGSMSAPGAAQTGQEAIQGQQQIDSAKAKAMVSVEQARLRAVQLNAQQDQNNINALKTHADNLAANIKNIDPDAYRKNMSAPDKVATGLGLFLGGFSVPFGGQNFAADFLNKQIDRDIQGQIQNNEKQKTIWGAYNTLYGDQNVASNMAKVSMADAYKDQIDQVAAKLGTPQALVNAQKLKAGLAVTQNKAILDASGNLSNTQNMPSRNQINNNGSNNVAPPQGGPNIRQISAPSNSSDNTPKAKSLIPSDDYADSPLLTPDAQGKLDSMQFGSPQQRANYPKALDQYTQAQQADTVLGQLHEVHQQLFKDAKEGGTAGYLRRHDPSASIPLAGHALSQMFIQPATDNQTNRDYDTNKTRIVSDIANALRGTNVSGGDIQRIVDDNTPEHGDTPKMVAQKERNIRVFIKNSVPKSLLKNEHMSK